MKNFKSRSAFSAVKYHFLCVKTLKFDFFGSHCIHHHKACDKIMELKVKYLHETRYLSVPEDPVFPPVLVRQ